MMPNNSQSALDGPLLPLNEALDLHSEWAKLSLQWGFTQPDLSEWQRLAFHPQLFPETANLRNIAETLNSAPSGMRGLDAVGQFSPGLALDATTIARPERETLQTGQSIRQQLALAWHRWLMAEAYQSRSPEIIERAIKIIRDSEESDQIRAVAPRFSFRRARLDDFGVEPFLDNPKPKIEWTLKGTLPKGTVGIVAADGGTGKSWFLLQLAEAVATGKPFLDGVFPAPMKGRVFAVFGEDQDDVLHCRLKDIHAELGDAVSAHDLKKNLRLMSGSGLQLQLMKPGKDGLEPTDHFNELLYFLMENGPLDLIVIDPVSRFYAGDENDSVAATFFITLLERIATETGATVLCSQHVNKGSQQDMEAALTQGASRGSSGFVNGARWQLNLVTVPREKRKKLGSNRDEPLIAAEVSKQNVGAKPDRFHLKRSENGVLRLFNATVLPEEQKTACDDEVVAEIIDMVNKSQDREELFNKRDLTLAVAAAPRMPGRPKIEAMVNRMLAEGVLAICQQKQRRLICNPELE